MAKPKQKTQSKKFIETARELGIDESDDPLDRILKWIVKPKPEKKETPDD